MNNITNIFRQLEAKLLSPADNFDATEILKEDHRTVEVLFQNFEQEEGQNDKQKILEMIIQELSVHTAVEEQLVYPLIDSQDHEKTNEALEEHHVVKLLLEELSHMKASNDATKAKVKVLSEAVKHHIKEEEWELFQKLRDSGADMQDLGAKILKAKRTFKSTMKEKMQEKAKQSPKSAGKTQEAPGKATRKTVAEKPAAKKTAAKKPAAKKPAAKKTAAKKSVDERSTAKKSVKKEVAAKPAAKKAAVKKLASKKAIGASSVKHRNMKKKAS